jgi:hypothetical protein
LTRAWIVFLKRSHHSSSKVAHPCARIFPKISHDRPRFGRRSAGVRMGVGGPATGGLCEFVASLPGSLRELAGRSTRARRAVSARATGGLPMFGGSNPSHRRFSRRVGGWVLERPPSIGARRINGGTRRPSVGARRSNGGTRRPSVGARRPSVGARRAIGITRVPCADTPWNEHNRPKFARNGSICHRSGRIVTESALNRR